MYPKIGYMGYMGYMGYNSGVHSLVHDELLGAFSDIFQFCSWMFCYCSKFDTYDVSLEELLQKKEGGSLSRTCLCSVRLPTCTKRKKNTFIVMKDTHFTKIYNKDYNLYFPR